LDFLDISFVKISKSYDKEKLKKLIEIKDKTKIEKYLYSLLFKNLDPQTLIELIKNKEDAAYKVGYKDCKEALKNFIML